MLPVCPVEYPSSLPTIKADYQKASGLNCVHLALIETSLTELIL